MISNIRINNFKSLADINMPCKNLNCITGINGMGKSSLIQTLLLLRQAYVPNGIGRGVHLKGNLTGNLGQFKDVLFRSANEEQIVFAIANEQTEYLWEFSKGDISDLLQGKVPAEKTPNLALFSESNFQYLSAARITPNSTFSKSGEELAYKQFGSSGEYAIQYLFEKGTEDYSIISEELDEHTGKPLPLINQVNYWLKNITPRVNLDIQVKSNTEYELRYKFVHSDKGQVSYSALNSAFGLTFALPIITALLAAQPGDLIILENPESDLHPRAQSIIGQLMARIAAAGVQLIVETHSDHILNGIYVAIHEGKLQSDLAKMFYFYKTDTEIKTTMYDIPIKPNGRVDDRVLRDLGIYGFFDQSIIDSEKILFTPSQNK